MADYNQTTAKELAKLIAANDKQAIAVGEASGILKNGQLQAGWQSKPVVANPTPKIGITNPVEQPIAQSVPRVSGATTQPGITRPVDIGITSTPRVAGGATQPGISRPVEMPMTTKSTSDLGKAYASGDPAALKELEARGAIKNGQLVPGWQNIQPGEVSTAQPLKQGSVADFSTERLQREIAGIQSIGGTPTNELQALIARGMQPQQQVQQQPMQAQPSFGGQISEQYSQETAALLARLKQRIAESKAQQEALISQAPQYYDPLRAQSEVAKSQQLRSALERSSVLGDKGGIGRSEALATQTAGEQRLGAINLQEQNFIDQANAEIARLENEGRYEEAAIVASQRAKELEALRNEQIRQENLALQRQSQEEGRFLDTLGQFEPNYQAQINQILGDNDPSNDWQADYLQAARQEKIAGQEQAAAEAQLADREALTAFEKQLYDRGFEKWKAGIPVTADEAAVLGVRPGSTKPVSSGGSSGFTPNQLFNNAQDKIKLGIPLSAQEAQVMGVEPGYVDPNFEGATAEPTLSFSDGKSAITRALGNVVKTDELGNPLAGLTQSQNIAVARELVNLSRKGMSDADVDRLQTIYGISDDTIDAVLRKEIPFGGF